MAVIRRTMEEWRALLAEQRARQGYHSSLQSYDLSRPRAAG